MTESNNAVTNQIRNQLAERWPALFNAQKPVPLAIGVNEALLEAFPDTSPVLLRRVMAHWCNRPRYLAAMTAGAARHGLQGVDGAVTEEQAANAAERLQTVLGLFRERDEAKRKIEQAQRAAAKKKAEQAEAKKKAAAAQAVEKEKEKPKAAPAEPKPTPAAPAAKPAGPAIIVKKRRFAPPPTD